MVSDPTLVQVLVRFLSGSSTNGTSQHSAQVGPTATQAMQEFLSRLQVHLSSTCPQMFSEFLLKLVHILTTERYVWDLHQSSFVSATFQFQFQFSIFAICCTLTWLNVGS